MDFVQKGCFKPHKRMMYEPERYDHRTVPGVDEADETETS